MPGSPRIEFGYNPPSGDRGKETIRPREYLGDLHQALDVATQGFSSIWVSVSAMKLFMDEVIPEFS